MSGWLMKRSLLNTEAVRLRARKVFNLLLNLLLRLQTNRVRRLKCTVPLLVDEFNCALPVVAVWF